MGVNVLPWLQFGQPGYSGRSGSGRWAVIALILSGKRHFSSASTLPVITHIPSGLR